MIVTDKFVFLHYPKTGGLFVSNVLGKVHAGLNKKRSPFRPLYFREIMLPNTKKKSARRVSNPHGTWEQIPKKHRAKPVVSCIRNPFDQYVSMYEYRTWSRRPPASLPRIRSTHPCFPELSFKEYLSFINCFGIEDRAHSETLRLDIGVITYAFIQFYFKNPGRIIGLLNDDYLASDQYKADMAETSFLRTENLNDDLHEFLLKFGYPPEDIAFIRAENKINATGRRDRNRSWRDYYSPDLIEFVRRRERFLFRLFPEYDDRTQDAGA